MTASKWLFPLFSITNAKLAAEEATAVDSTVWQGIFSKHSYATLTGEGQAEIKQFLDAFYAGCQLLSVSQDPNNSDVLKALGVQHGIVCLTEENNKTLYYAEFDALQNQHIIKPFVVLKKDTDQKDTNIYVSQKQHDVLLTFTFPEIDESRPATPEELKSIRAVTDCMRFKTPAVLAIFDQRKARKEALANSQALLDGLIPDAFQFYDAHQVQHLDEALRFALYQYLAHAQAATDHIGVIRSQHTELASCYRKIKQCTLYRKQLMLRQVDLDLQALNDAKDEAAKDKLVAIYKTRYQLQWDVTRDTYNVLGDYQKTLVGEWAKYGELEVFHRQMNAALQDLELMKWAIWLRDEDALTRLKEKYKCEDATLNELKGLIEQARDKAQRRRDELKQDLDALDASIESLKPEQLASCLSFLKEDEDELDSDYCLSQLSKGNARRLYWVWTRCLVEMLIISAHQVLLVSTMIAAWVSWSLYWFRGSVTATAAFQHSWDKLVSERERVIHARKRMLAHLEERRDEIANDLVWGSSNFACCFWLTGVGLLSFIGDLLTLILLGMDLTLAALRWSNGQSAHQATINSYDEQLMALMSGENLALVALREKYKILQGLQTQKYFVLNPWRRQEHEKQLKQALKGVELALAAVQKQDDLKILCLHWKTLFAAQQAYLKQWQNKYATLIYDVVYAVILAVGFGFMCFAPIAGLSLFGAVLLVASTVLWRTLYAKDDVAGITQIIDATEKEYFACLAQFIELAADFKASCDKKDLIQQSQTLDAQMKQLYLHIRALGAKSGYERELKRFKLVEFSRYTFMRFVVPVAIALTLLLAPTTIATLPTYVFLLLGILVFAVATSMAIHRWIKPRASVWEKRVDAEINVLSTAGFDEQEYLAFRRSVLIDSSNDVLSPVIATQESEPLLESDQKTFDQQKGKESGQELLIEMKKHRIGKNAQQMHLFSSSKYTKEAATKRDTYLGLISLVMGA